jgi:aquaporin Z
MSDRLETRKYQMINSFRQHWPEYLMEAAGLGIFMVSAGVFATLLEYPQSPVHQIISNPLVRRFLMGCVMGLTAVAIIYSPWGQQSGAHLNPAVTLTFLRLGKVALPDAVFYILAQFTGGVLGVLLVIIILGNSFTMPPVSYVATLPGKTGVTIAFFSELIISFGLMIMVLFTTNSLRLSRYTGVFAGILIMVYITFEAPLSGMSINPARTLASALPGGLWTALWVYFTAPVLGMLAASLAYQLIRSKASVKCAKLNHHTTRRCIFCGYGIKKDIK